MYLSVSKNLKIIDRLERHRFELPRWPQKNVRDAAVRTVARQLRRRGRGDCRVGLVEPHAWLNALVERYGDTLRPVIATEWGFLIGNSDRQREGQGSVTGVSFYAPLLMDRDGMARVKAKCMAAIWRELKQVGMLHSGIGVEQGDPGALFALTVEHHSQDERSDVEGALQDFLTILFVVDRVGQILCEVMGIDDGPKPVELEHHAARETLQASV